MTAVSIHLGWHIFRECKSDSSEWPSKTGVGETERTERTCAWTSSNVVVAVSRASAVMPDQRVR